MAFGGGCHWCTEAVFQHVPGVSRVDQGWCSSRDAPERFSEGVIVHYDASAVALPELIAVHLHTHACTSAHALRGKYRSAVYCFSESELPGARAAVAVLQAEFERPILTEVVRMGGFRQNTQRYQDYYRKNPEAPFCRRWIAPKLALLRRRQQSPPPPLP